MANGTGAEDFMVLSRVRTGLKREFEFALKVQAEICGSLGRTRSRRVSNEPACSPGRTSNKKFKRDGKVVVENVDLTSEEEAKSDVLDVEEPKRDTVACEEESKRVELEKEEEAKSELEKPLIDSKEEEEKETKMDIDIIEKESQPCETDEGIPVLVSCESDGKVEKVVDKKMPLRRFTRSMLKNAEEEGKEKDETVVQTLPCERDVGISAFVSCESNGKVEEMVAEKKPMRRFTRSSLKPGVEMVKETATTDGTGVKESNVKMGSDHDIVESLDGSKKQEVKGYSEQCEGKEKEEPVMQSSPCERDVGNSVLVSCQPDSKVEEMVLEKKPMRRFTRSLLKPVVEMVKETAARDAAGVEKSNMKMGSDHDIAESLDSSKKQEVNASIKSVRNFPTKLKDLLSSGMLEGVNVRYARCTKVTRSSESSGLQGVIKGSGILCFCSVCKGFEVVTPTIYEIHAGSLNKRPAEYIYLESGKTLRDVMIACKENAFTTLGDALQMVIGSSMKSSSFCLNCKESIAGDGSGKPIILCKSCLGLKESQVSSIELADARDRSPKPSVISKSTTGASKCSSSQTKSQGRVTRKDLRMHKLVFEEDGLPDGTELAYFVRGEKLLVGYKRGSGILCTCCNSEVSPSQFEAHAGMASRRKPFQHIYTSNGVSLHELSISLSKNRKFSTNENDDLCSICLESGNLLCCDTCPRAFHKECISLPSIPTGTWYCRYCQNTFQKEKFVEHNANAIAAGRIAGIDPIEAITKRCIRIIKTPETEVPSVCVLCRGHTFSKSGFGTLTVILCDQCEREYHVGCLRDHKMEDLKELPKEKWFCSTECQRIHSALQKLIVRGEEKLPDSSLHVVKKKQERHSSESNANPDVRWRVLSGKMISSDDTRVLLSKAVSIFHDRFDPISDSGSSKGDLIPSMVYGRTVRGQDFGGMYCAILTVNQVIVSAGIFRVFGQELAEIPLVATSTESQGQGYFQCLFTCLEKFFGFLNLKNIVLPAADEAESIWTKKFGFSRITQEELSNYRRDYQLMIFQGTSILRKSVPEIRLVANSEEAH